MEMILKCTKEGYNDFKFSNYTVGNYKLKREVPFSTGIIFKGRLN